MAIFRVIGYSIEGVEPRTIFSPQLLRDLQLLTLLGSTTSILCKCNTFCAQTVSTLEWCMHSDKMLVMSGRGCDIIFYAEPCKSKIAMH